jgi:hypothetical protein
MSPLYLSVKGPGRGGGGREACCKPVQGTCESIQASPPLSVKDPDGNKRGRHVATQLKFIFSIKLGSESGGGFL